MNLHRKGDDVNDERSRSYHRNYEKKRQTMAVSFNMEDKDEAGLLDLARSLPKGFSQTIKIYLKEIWKKETELQKEAQQERKEN